MEEDICLLPFITEAPTKSSSHWVYVLVHDLQLQVVMDEPLLSSVRSLIYAFYVNTNPTTKSPHAQVLKHSEWRKS